MNFSRSRAALQRCLVWLCLGFALYAGVSTLSYAGIVAPEGEFDHLATGFPLVGRHRLFSCETCHRDGVFKGLPRKCAGCHDNKTARGKPINHIPTVEQCDVCHLPQGFNVGAVMDHSTTSMPCFTCHNGALASGKGTSHLPTSNNCAGCHGTTVWVPARFDHTETSQACVSCHDGRLATGKSSGHPETNNNCAACHRTSAFLPALTVDHREIAQSAACAASGCHDGIAHKGKPSVHIRSTNECGACHAKVKSDWKILFGRSVDHTRIPNNINRCPDCHVTASKLQGLTPSTQPPDHIPTTASCDLCHVTTGWLPAKRVHSVQTITDKCAQCHVAGIRATAKPLSHIPTREVCEVCHTSTARSSLADWKKPNITTDFVALHTQTIGTCASCHDGTKATGKNLGHMDTAADCSVCHKGTTTFKGAVAVVDHTGFVKNCTTCHGKTASGTSGPLHAVAQVFVAGTNCDSCHRPYPSTWSTAFTFDHSLVQPLPTCVTCHDGTGIRAKKGQNFISNHIPTTAPAPSACDACHKSTIVWDAKTDHASYTVNCVSCHDGTFKGAPGKAGKHLSGLQTSNICEACHNKAPLKWSPILTFNHAQAVNSGACSSCHDGILAQGRSPAHPPTTVKCAGCHTDAVSLYLWKRPLSAQMDHGETSAACATAGCHDQTIAQRKPSHIALIARPQCDACHGSTSKWSIIKVVEHTQVVGSCFSCHNGTTATGKSGLHLTVSTSENCDLCHFIPPRTFAGHRVPFPHRETAAAPCESCHNATYASFGYKTSGHMTTTNFCGQCHTTGSGWTGSAVKTNHGVDAITGDCEHCHNGSTRGRSKPPVPVHCPTTLACNTCHSSTSSWTTNVASCSTTTPIPTPLPTPTPIPTPTPLPTPTAIPTPTPTPPPMLTFTANPVSVVSGGSSTLNWSSSNASACSASNTLGAAAWSGTKLTVGSWTLTNLTTTTDYTLACTGPGGIVNLTVRVTVTTPPPPPPPPPPPGMGGMGGGGGGMGMGGGGGGGGGM